MSFKMNFNARDLEKAVTVEAKKGLTDQTAEIQRYLDVVAERYAGQPASMVSPHVRSAVRGTIFDKQGSIDFFAKAISEGNRPVLNLKM